MVTGKRKSYSWMVSDGDLHTIVPILLATHTNQYLTITAFDSGPVSPGEDEKKAGWRASPQCMISPPIRGNLVVPYCQYDEWWIFDNPVEIPEPKRYVNYLGFTLQDPQDITKDRDETRELDAMDWLRPVQTHFWNLMENMSAITYVCCNGKLVVATKNNEFWRAATKAA